MKAGSKYPLRPTKSTDEKTNALKIIEQDMQRQRLSTQDPDEDGNEDDEEKVKLQERPFDWKPTPEALAEARYRRIVQENALRESIENTPKILDLDTLVKAIQPSNHVPVQQRAQPPALQLTLDKDNKTKRDPLTLYLTNDPCLDFCFKHVNERLSIIPRDKDILKNIFFTPTPKDSSEFNFEIASHLLCSRKICFSSGLNIYFYNEELRLFEPIRNPTGLVLLLTNLFKLIRLYMQNIMKTFVFELKPMLDEKTFGMGNKTLTLIYDNINKFDRHSIVTSQMCTNVYSLITNMMTRKEFRAVALIPWLHEGGVPGHLPTADGQVVVLKTFQIKPRDQFDAFTTDCDMLSMQYTAAEIIAEYSNLCKYKDKQDILDNYICLFIKTLKEIANDDSLTLDQILFLFATVIGECAKVLWHFYSPWTDSGKTLISKLIKMVLGSKCASQDFSLISSKSAIHQTAKSHIREKLAVILDESDKADKWDYNLQELQIMTSGCGTIISGRVAKSEYMFEFMLTSSLIKFSNYKDFNPPFRQVVIALKSGFCESVDGPYHRTWYKDAVTMEELKDDLNPSIHPHAIKKINRNLLNEFTREEKLKMLCVCIFYAQMRITNPELYESCLLTAATSYNSMSSSLYDFMNCEIYCTDKERRNKDGGTYIAPDSGKEELIPRQNPYIFSPETDTPDSKLVKFADYYRTYCAFVLRNLPGERPLGKTNFKQQLETANLLTPEGDRVRFLADQPTSLPELGDVLEQNYETLIDTPEYRYKISDGIKRSEFHEAIKTKIRTDNIKRVQEGLQKLNIPTSKNIESWIFEFKREWIKGSGKSDTRYYHVRRKL